MRPILNHLRVNIVGYIALIVALGGTSYAAVDLAPSSVGSRQLRTGAVTNPKIANFAITPIKFNQDVIGGSVRHWAYVSQDGRALGGSSGVQVSGGGPIYHVSWGKRFPSSCAAMVTPAGSAGAAPIADSTGVAVTQPGTPNGATVVYVWTYSSGALTPAPFYLAIIC